jgi:hypothetical protein
MYRTTRAPGPIGFLLLLAATCALAQPAAAQDAGPPGPFRFASLEDGRAAARREAVPVLVLVTAPGWCAPCDRLESRLREDRSMQRAVTEGFVAVRLTDRDPEHAALEFPGYPSFVVLHPAGRRLGAFRAPQSAAALRAALRPYQRPLAELDAHADDAARAVGAAGTARAAPDPGREDAAAAADREAPAAPKAPRAAYRYPGGTFLRLGDDAWARETEGGRTRYSVYREDDRYVYLQSEEGEEFFAIPRDGGRAFEWNGAAEAWESTWQVSGPQ